VLPAIAYLDFAHRWYGRVEFDLATSGIASISAGDLGTPPASDDHGARMRFCASVARRYGVDPAEVVPTLGASGALFVAQATLLERGQRWLVEHPSYEPLWRGAEALGFAVDRFERRLERGFSLDPEAILASLRPETRVVAITNPHNPTGVVLSDAELRRVAEALASRSVTLFVDEAYLELARPGSTARKLGPNVVTCSSATKCWGASFARAGWLLGPPELGEPATRVERFVSGIAPPACWALGERLFERADALVERARRIQAGKRDKVNAFVAAHSDRFAWCPPPESALFGWLVDRGGRNLLPRLERGVRELGVIAAPGSFFGEPAALRLGWTCDISVLDEGLSRLGRALGDPS
jgi:aspartate/methionine/tyrosine aminotransferase